MTETHVAADFVIYTDGACSPNPGTGGWSFVCLETNAQHYGGERQTTNNRMEMMAILQALRHFREHHDTTTSLKVVSDSEYLVKGCSEWLAGWKRRGWTRKKGELLNVDLWKLIDEAMSGLNVIFQWVRGHDGNHWNELADRLAVRGANECTSSKATPPQPPPKTPLEIANDEINRLRSENAAQAVRIQELTEQIDELQRHSELDAEFAGMF